MADDITRAASERFHIRSRALRYPSSHTDCRITLSWTVWSNINDWHTKLKLNIDLISHMPILDSQTAQESISDNLPMF